MRPRSPEPKGKLGAMTGYSFSTPVWDGGTWVTPVVSGVTGRARIANGPEDQPRNAPARWDKIHWRDREEPGRRSAAAVFQGPPESRRPKAPSPANPSLRPPPQPPP